VEGGARCAAGEELMTDNKLKSLAENDFMRRAADIRRRFQANRQQMAELFREANRNGYDRATICIELAKRRDERIADGTYKPGRDCIYFCRVLGHDLIKIGVTNGLKSRVAVLEKQIGCPLDLLGTINGDHHIEYAIHSQLVDARVREFGLTEMFTYSAVEERVMGMLLRDSAVVETRQ
jgi:hypothetical protein